MTDEQKAQIEAIRAKRAELRAQREARDAVDPVAAEQKLLDEEQLILDLETEFGKVGVGLAVVRCKDGRLMAGKKPHPATYQKFYDDKDKATFSVMREFLIPCMVYPRDKVEQGKMIDEFAGAADMLAGMLAGLCGADPKG